MAKRVICRSREGFPEAAHECCASVLIVNSKTNKFPQKPNHEICITFIALTTIKRLLNVVTFLNGLIMNYDSADK